MWFFTMQGVPMFYCIQKGDGEGDGDDDGDDDGADDNDDDIGQ